MAPERLLLPYRLRTVRIGIETSVAAVAALALLALLPGQELHTLRFAFVLAAEVVGLAALMRLPWQRLLSAGHGDAVQALWVSGNVGLTLLAVAITGGGRSELYILFTLTTAFSAAAVAPRVQVALLFGSLSAYVLVVAATGWHVRAETLAFRVAMIAILGYLTGFLSRELALRAAEKEHLSLHDPLTELANRSLFHHLVDDAVAAANRDGHTLGVLVIDLDRFKEVNDSLGHAIGDALLRQVGPRLRAELRDDDTLARLGGDEFAVLLPKLDDAAAARAIGRRLAAALEHPFVVESVTLDLEASIGVAVLPEHGRTGDELMRSADVAMYAAKEVRSGCELYDDRAEDGAGVRRLALLGELRRALEAHQLLLHYQPKVDLRTGRLRGVEALVRWQHPERGLVPPDEFVPLVEQTGLIGPLTRYVLDHALRQARSWHEDGLPVTVAVNVSVRNLHDARFPAQVRELLAAHGVPPERLELELTESSIMTRPARALESLLALSELGVALVLDDFGTGFSSLAQLSRLPVSEIKIDKSFVLSMDTTESDEVLVRAMVDIGRNLGLSVVAEGVETEASWERLRELGCDVAQGYYLSRPIPAAEIDAWAERWQAAA